MAPLFRLPPSTTTTTTRLTQHLRSQHPQARCTSLLSQKPSQSQRHALHTTTPRPSSSHESPYDPPTGDLWGVPAGQTYQKEGWENVFIYGFFGSLLFGVVGYAFKSDTSIETWALEEAKRRLQAEGILPEEEE